MIAKFNFQPPLQSSTSHDPLEIILIWFGVKETFLIFVVLETVVLLNIFVKIKIKKRIEYNFLFI